jgi:MFS superfamily sulfate permease-like transporter
MGKKIGIIAMILAILCGICTATYYTTTDFDAMYSDTEDIEGEVETLDISEFTSINPKLYTVAILGMSYGTLITIVVGIVSIVIMIHKKEKGIIIPILAILIVILTNIFAMMGLVSSSISEYDDGELPTDANTVLVDEE